VLSHDAAPLRYRLVPQLLKPKIRFGVGLEAARVSPLRRGEGGSLLIRRKFPVRIRVFPVPSIREFHRQSLV